MKHSMRYDSTDKSLDGKELEPLQKYPAGHKFIRAGRKHRHIETVTDFLVARNLNNEVVKVRYVATHKFCGQIVTDSDVIPTTIDRSTYETPETGDILNN